MFVNLPVNLSITVFIRADYRSFTWIHYFVPSVVYHLFINYWDHSRWLIVHLSVTLFILVDYRSIITYFDHSRWLSFNYQSRVLWSFSLTPVYLIYVISLIILADYRSCTQGRSFITYFVHSRWPSFNYQLL